MGMWGSRDLHGMIDFQIREIKSRRLFLSFAYFEFRAPLKIACGRELALVLKGQASCHIVKSRIIEVPFRCIPVPRVVTTGGIHTRL